jgi:adenine-specific DNA-methyltransferase
LHAEFFSISDPEKKKILKRKIDNIEDELIQSKCHEEIKNAESFVQNSVNDSKKILKGTEKMLAVKGVLDKWKRDHLRPFFPWKLHFGEVFNKEESGFDIVIGNPPYIKEYTSKDAFKDLKASPYYQGKMDLWYFFACYGLDFLKNNGVQAFIAPNNWISNYGAKIMRNKILNEAKICQFLDFGNYKVFDTAGIQTMVYLLKKDNDNESYKLKIGKLKNENPNSDILSGFLNTEFDENNDNFGKFEIEFAKKNFLDKTIQFLDSEIDTITNKIENNGNFYLLSGEVANGIHPHFDFVNKKQLPVLKKDFIVGDGIFGLSDEEKNELNLQENEKDIIKPYYLTSEFFKYGSMRNNTHWIIYTDSRFKDEDEMEKYPNIKKHLDKFVKVITSDNKPYGLHRARDEKFFKGEKIVVARKCISPEFSYNDFDCYVSATFYVIKSDRINSKYLLAILNSKLIKYWLMHKGKMQGNNYQIDKEPLLQIPIAIASEKNQEDIILLIDQILKEKGQDKNVDTENIESQIDQLVYKIYNLTEKEILTVENK